MTLTLQTINVGGQANDGSGDSPRAAGQKINANFGEVAAAIDTQNAGIEQKFAQQDQAIGAFLDAAGDQVDEMLEDLATGQFPAGTLAGPSIAFSVDPDTGFYRPAADTVAAVVGGAEALRWSASGLTVQGHFALGATGVAPANGMYRSAANEIGWSTASTLRMRMNNQGLFYGVGGTGAAAPYIAIEGGSAANGGGYIRFNKAGATVGYVGHESAMDGGGSTSNTMILQSAAAVKIRSANVDRVIIDTAGNVGVGRAADVVANYRVLDMDGASGGYIGLRQAGTTHGVIYANSGQVILQANGALPVAIFTNGVERIRANGNGNIGIGTDNPGAKLDVQGGDIRASGTIRPGSFTVATLPSASAAGSGAKAYVTDASATTYRAIVAGGGSNRITVVSDATNWLIGA